MKTIIIAIAGAVSLCVLSPAAVSSADVLVMRDGTRLDGTVVGIAARTITFRHADGVSRRYTTSQVEALEFLSAERVNPKAVDSNRLTARAGTELVVRTVETIDSRNSGSDQVFSAIVEQDVDSDSHLVVPARSSAQLVIRQVSPSGATGSPEMALDIQSIAIAGKRYVVRTADATPESDAGMGATKRTAETTRAGALRGTIIAAIPAAAKDAPGGLVGAGGVSAPVLTSGHEVQVPADTVIRFRLDKLLILQAER
jgi:hypothetical protein